MEKGGVEESYWREGIESVGCDGFDMECLLCTEADYSHSETPKSLSLPKG